VISLLVLGSALVAANMVLDMLGGTLGQLTGMLTVVLGTGLGFLTVYLTIQLYHRFNKCGLMWWIREGISVYVFTNRSKMSRANNLYRMLCQVRDERLKNVGHS